MRKKSKGGLVGSVLGLLVVGYVTDWYQIFWLKHRADIGQVCWSESRGRDQTLTVKLKISGEMVLQMLRRR
jgi:hypothetical protein